MNNRNREFPNLYPRLFPGGKVKTVTFLVTHACNLRCTYCYEHGKGDKRMELETAKKCIDLLFRMDEEGNELVNPSEATALILDFMGGEPLLEVELIDRVVGYFLGEAMRRNHRWAVHYMISISTNGTVDTPAVRQFLAKYKGRVSVGVTIDGDKEAHDACRVDAYGHGSYDRAIALYRAVAPPGERTTKYTIAPGNLRHTATAIQHLIEREGAGVVNCNCVYEKGWERRHGKDLYLQLKEVAEFLVDQGHQAWVSILDWEAGGHLPDTDTQNWCGGAGKMLCFDVDGTILPCARYSAVAIGERRPQYRIGDLECGIGHREDDKGRLAALQAITRQSQSKRECLGCPINAGCGWCTAYNYEETGEPGKRVTYICVMHKARVLAQLYYHAIWHRADSDHPARPLNMPEEWAVDTIGAAEYIRLKQILKEGGMDGKG